MTTTHQPSDLDSLYNPEITDLEKNDYQGIERPVIYLDEAKALLTKMLAQARIDEWDLFAAKSEVDEYTQDYMDERKAELDQPVEMYSSEKERGE